MHVWTLPMSNLERNQKFYVKSILVNSELPKLRLKVQKLYTVYSVSTLETTIFREIISLVRVNFSSTFLGSWLTPYFVTLMGGNTHPLLPPIRMEKYRIK